MNIKSHHHTNLFFLVSVVLVFGFFYTTAVYAYEIEKLPDTPVVGDFVVGPGKAELSLNPGESKRTEIIVTNRMGRDRIFNLEIEDFTGSKDPTQTVVLLGDQRGPYSLKNYLRVSESEFVLGHGERVRIPVTVSIPSDEEPGGKFGSVLISTTQNALDTDDSRSGASTGAAIIARIGTLFFVTVPGNVKEEGELSEFTIGNNKKVFNKGPIPFQILFENDGSVHLNPYGIIEIRNFLGEEIGVVEVEPWFALPNSLRLREVSFDRELLIGRYVATAKINRGYDNVVDEISVTFWVLPWKMVGGGFVVIFFVLLVLRFVFSKFEIRKKS